MFVKKGYCRWDGKLCKHLKLQYGEGFCNGYCKKKTKWYTNVFFIVSEKTGRPKDFYVHKNAPISNIKAPSWCPKLKH